MAHILSSEEKKFIAHEIHYFEKKNIFTKNLYYYITYCQLHFFENIKKTNYSKPIRTHIYCKVFVHYRIIKKNQNTKTR